MSDTQFDFDSLHDGESYAGLIVGSNGRPAHHVVLLADEASEVAWPAARAWAQGTGGDLPNRRELSLLYANLKEHFERQWYWSCEPQDGRAQLVWGQNFTSGIQTLYGRAYRGRACAVRRHLIGAALMCPAVQSAQQFPSTIDLSISAIRSQEEKK